MASLQEQCQLLNEDVEKADFDDTRPSSLQSPSSRGRTWTREGILIILLAISLCANLRFIFAPATRSSGSDFYRTKFAELAFDTPSEFRHDTIYNHENDTISQAAWDSIHYDRGSVALTLDEIEAYGLPMAQHFPWDKNKRMYFINGHHGLHCLKDIHLTMVELRDGLPLSYTWQHTMHCLEAVRQDIICFADDSLLYTPEGQSEPAGISGRMCRSWEKLEEWSAQHTSCWRDINPTEPIDTLLRYRYCPDDSPYNKWIHAIFGDFDKGPGASATT